MNDLWLIYDIPVCCWTNQLVWMTYDWSMIYQYVAELITTGMNDLWLIYDIPVCCWTNQLVWMTYDWSMIYQYVAELITTTQHVYCRNHWKRNTYMSLMYNFCLTYKSYQILIDWLVFNTIFSSIPAWTNFITRHSMGSSSIF